MTDRGMVLMQVRARYCVPSRQVTVTRSFAASMRVTILCRETGRFSEAAMASVSALVPSLTML